MKRKICAFSGHRPQKFPWQYNESDSRCVKLKIALAERIADLVDCEGVTDVLTGGAEGADTWAALTVLSLCEKNPVLRLHCILPYRRQSDSWSASAREQYREILDRADSVVYLNREYRRGCMLERNRFMVDHADMLLAVYNGEQRGGTAATVRYAKKIRKTRSNSQSHYAFRQYLGIVALYRYSLSASSFTLSYGCGDFMLRFATRVWDER